MRSVLALLLLTMVGAAQAVKLSGELAQGGLLIGQAGAAESLQRRQLQRAASGDPPAPVRYSAH